MSLSLITAPTVEPVSITEAMVHLRLDSGNEDSTTTDAEIARLITAMRERGEVATLRAWNTQTWDQVMDDFPCEGYIEVAKAPLQSVTHLKYRDTAGTLQTWAASNYVVEAPAGPRCRRGRLSLAYNIAWPATYGQAGDVTVRFVAGYGAAVAVPAALKTALLFDLESAYRERGSVVTNASATELPRGAADIYRAYKSWPRQRVAA